MWSVGEEAAAFAVHAFQKWGGGVEVVVNLDVSPAGLIWRGTRPTRWMTSPLMETGLTSNRVSRRGPSIIWGWLAFIRGRGATIRRRAARAWSSCGRAPPAAAR